MRNCKFWSVFSSVLLGCLLILASPRAGAVVNIDRTRIVVPNASDVVTFNLVNNSTEQPALVQLWIDTGDPTVPPDKIRSPLVLLPPMFRLEANEQRNVRLLIADPKQLPTDRESVFWLNVYQMPPVNQQQDKQRLILPIRLRIKVFIRRGALPAPQEEDLSKLTFTQASGNLCVHNPTPWHLTISGVDIDGQKVDGDMVAPFGNLPLPLAARLSNSNTLTYTLINDAGNPRTFQTTLHPAPTGNAGFTCGDSSRK